MIEGWLLSELLLNAGFSKEQLAHYLGMNQQMINELLYDHWPNLDDIHMESRLVALLRPLAFQR